MPRHRALALLLAAPLALAACGSETPTTERAERPSAAPAQTATPSGQLEGDALLEAIDEGGLVLFLRHAETTTGGVDSPDAIGDCTRERMLSDAGRDDARALGEAVRALGVPIDRVVTSPLCRTVETAELAFGDVVEDPALLPFATAALDSAAAADEVAVGTRRLLAEVPPDGSNTVLVGHISTLEAVAAVAPEEGGTVVFRPDGTGDSRVIGQIGPGGWVELAASAD